jgi:hypothetical protein
MGGFSRLRRGAGALAFIGLLACARCAALSGLDNLEKADCVERCDGAPEEAGTIPGDDDGSPDAIPSEAPSDSIAEVDAPAMPDSSQMDDSGEDGNLGSDDGQGSLDDGPVDAISSDAYDASAMGDAAPPPDSAPPDGAPTDVGTQTDAGTLQDVADGDSSAPSDAAAEAGVTTTDHTPTKDAYVRDGTFAAMNFGADVTLAVKNAYDGPPGISFSRRTWVTFDISRYTSITAAKLRLFLMSLDNTDANAVFESVFSTPAASNGWGELTITWNNVPAIGPQIASTRVDTPNVGTWVEWDVTSAVQTEIGGMATFVIEAGVTSLRLAVFSSREGMHPPVLRITGD